MKTVSTIPQLRTQIAEWHHNKQNIGFVPTMGNLHEGHLSLVEQALSISERVVVSIFVNPLQFGPNEDYDTYPRTLEADQEKLRHIGTHLLFTPQFSDIYPMGIEACTYVNVPGLSDILCGASRPGFFKGVATIVNVLFNLVQPQKAIFGKKDYQQLLVIKRMVTDLYLPIEIIGVPILREADGLAMSSRNQYLNAQQRTIAPHLFQTLDHLRKQLETGEHDFWRLENEAFQHLNEIGFEADYVAIRETQTLNIPTSIEHELIILAAARLGTARLIDNVMAYLI